MGEHANGKFVLKAQKEGLSLYSIFETTVIGVLLFFVTLFYLQGLFHRTQRAEEARKSYNQPMAASEVRAGQQAHLNVYSWTDAENEFVSIPITDAKKALLQRLSAGQAVFPDLPQQAAQPLAAPADPAAETTEPAADGEAAAEESATAEVSNSGGPGSAEDGIIEGGAH